jgi:hypothetical protein
MTDAAADAQVLSALEGIADETVGGVAAAAELAGVETAPAAAADEPEEMPEQRPESKEAVRCALSWPCRAN